MVAVFDHEFLVCAEGAVVAPGDDLISDEHPLVADSESVCVDVEQLARGDASVLSQVVESGHGVGAVGHERHRLRPAGGPAARR